MFRITQGKGFQITFENGYTVSVQFGPGNYCENKDGGFSEEEARQAGERGSSAAETAFWGPDGNFIRIDGDCDDVQGWQSPAQVLALLNHVAGIK